MKMSADQEGKVESSMREEDKTVKNDQQYENICRHIVSKCAFLLVGVQPAIHGESISLTLRSCCF